MSLHDQCQCIGLLVKFLLSLCECPSSGYVGYTTVFPRYLNRHKQNENAMLKSKLNMYK